jgi:hypothetical protein
VRVVLAAVVLLAAGCGNGQKPLPPACSDGPPAILRALRSAPGVVRLSDGTRLSDCVARSYGDGEIQELGFSFTPAADRLVARGTPEAAVQLGYLVGAVERGARHTNGVQGEIVRRLERTITLIRPALQADARRGVRAGEATG